MLVLVYTSGLIDLFKNNEFYNIPDLTFIKRPEIRKVYQVYTEDGFAYLSTTYGVVVIDLDKQEIARTFKFQINNETVPRMVSPARVILSLRLHLPGVQGTEK